MRNSISRRSLLLGAAVLSAGSASAAAVSFSRAAQSFLKTLTPEERAVTVFPLEDAERLNWHYVPKERTGISLGMMSATQRAAAITLLQAGLSVRGYEKIETIRSLESVLKILEHGQGPLRDPENYHFTLYGSPDPEAIWGLRYEGHHISLNWLCARGRLIASTPQFLGANPAEVRSGVHKGLRALAGEEDLARTLLESLNPKQRAIAVIRETAPPDIITTNQRKVEILENHGLAGEALTAGQRKLLLALLKEHASVQSEEIARRRLAVLQKEGLSGVRFAWMGSLQRGAAHYYRLQNERFLVEYDNTQNEANHIHVVWRDFHNDFGIDWLEQHYHLSNADHNDH